MAREIITSRPDAVKAIVVSEYRPANGVEMVDQDAPESLDATRYTRPLV